MKCRRVFAPHKLQFIVDSVSIEKFLLLFLVRCQVPSLSRDIALFPFDILLLVVSWLAAWRWVVCLFNARAERKPIYKHKHINSFGSVWLRRLLLRCTSHRNEKDQLVDASSCALRAMDGRWTAEVMELLRHIYRMRVKKMNELYSSVGETNGKNICLSIFARHN